MDMVKQGYKQTEIGIIPEDWEVKFVKEFTDCTAGGTPSTQIKEYWNGNIPWMNSGELNKKKVYDVENSITELGYNNSSTKLIPEKCVLIGLAGQGKTRGTVAINFMELCINQSIGAFLPSKQYITEYLFYNLENRYEEIRGLSSGDGGRGGLNLQILKSLQIPLPPLPEQEAIAEALSDADAWIASLEQLIAKKRLIKQGAMQELLTPRDDWESKSLFEIADKKRDLFNDGDWIESEHIIDEGIRLVQTGNIGIGKFLNKGGRKYISEKSFNDLKCKEIKEGDLLICRLAEPAGRACIFPKTEDYNSVTSVDVTIFRPDVQKYNREFLMYTFCTNEWFTDIIEKVGGTTHKRISRGNLGGVSIKIPSLSEQTRIATILSDMDAELEALEQKLSKARQIKQGMMQELLTGRIRL